MAMAYERFRELGTALDDVRRSAAQESAERRSELADAIAAVTRRLDQLEQAFRAYVELSAMQPELAAFEDESRVRHAAEQLLDGLARRGAGPPAPAELLVLPADLPPCPGYWLRPAVSWLSAGRGTSQARPDAVLAEAQRLDPVRTAVFLIAGLALSGQAPAAYPLLPRALGQPEEQTTHLQRLVWCACAEEVFGGPGQDLVTGWLAGHVRSLDASTAESQIATWRTACGAAFGLDALRRKLQRELGPLQASDALVSPLVAAHGLSQLKVLVSEALAGEPAGPAGPGAAVPGPARSGPETSGPGPLPGDLAAGLAAMAAGLVAEGSEKEVPLLSRARELQEVIDGTKTAAVPGWDAAQGATLNLLRADAFGTDRQLRRVAVLSCADWVRQIAAELAGTARRSPPERISAVIHNWHIDLTAAGRVSLRTASSEIQKMYEPETAMDKLLHRKDLAASAELEKQVLATDAQKAAAVFSERVPQLRAAARQATADRDAITAALAAAGQGGEAQL